jgi:hypothetical protein
LRTSSTCGADAARERRDVQASDAGDRYTVRSYMATKVRVLARLGF